MIASVSSLIAIVVISGFVIRFIYLHTEKFSDRSHVHVVTMSLSSLISLTFACVLATSLHSPFILSIFFGLALGYIIGKPLGLFAITDGMVAGWMGSLMGIMVPMVAHLSPFWLTIFMDAMFLLMISVIFKLIFHIKQTSHLANHQDKSDTQTLSG